ncbi:B-box zinc finger protein 22 isoform X2 [Abrus precatorius]|uniref:B-box zinc finger protein 22 isoform X2 n=1 Tax=Abrus precatorius TaxID=3816 RepID=A0A8B8KDD6_ABRPR|nr:B-box zinc finger protein 22 isoform X2 [Abrus precatorius]
MRQLCVGNVMRRFMLLTSLLASTREFLFLPLPLICPNVTFVRKCDLAIHTANTYVSGHQRFLLTGVRVGLEATEPGASSTSLKSDSGEKISDTKSSSVSRKVSTMPQPSDYNEVLPFDAGLVGEFPPAKVSYGGGSTAGNISQWTIDEFIGLNEFSQNYNYMGGSSRADSGKLGDSDSPVLRSSEEEMEEDDDHLDCVPDSSWTVPQMIPSPPTASGLYWPKDPQRLSDSVLFVPDICFSQMQQPQNSSNFLRRRRHL